jgi:hypothetical protein
MRAIDSPHKISPNRIIFEKIFESKKHEKITQIPFFYTLCKNFQLNQTASKLLKKALLKDALLPSHQLNNYTSLIDVEDRPDEWQSK